MTSRPPLSAEVFDAAFREAATSEWTQRVLGADLPPDVDAYSFITLDGLREIARLVADCHGGTLLDLACGRGGPGLWLARQIGAHLIGIDFSPVGIEHATAKAAEIAPDVQVRYIVADATATTLPSDSVDGLVCVDAIQLMADRAGVMAEVRRVLKPERWLRSPRGRRPSGWLTWQPSSSRPGLSSSASTSALTGWLASGHLQPGIGRCPQLPQRCRAAEPGRGSGDGLAPLRSVTTRLGRRPEAALS